MKRVTRGFLTVEILMVLVVVTAGMALGFQWLKASTDQVIDQVTAEHARQVSDATSRYIKDNYSTVLAAATPQFSFTPAAISVYLPTNFNTKNPYGQSYSIRVYQPTAKKLETMIVTTDGETITETSLRKIARNIGAQGGYVSSNNISVAQGAYGGWEMSFTNYGSTPGAGKLVMAIFFQDGSQVSDYLYRNAIPGHPELNQMTTPLNMRAQAQENTSDTNCIVGDSSTYGRIAVDTIGAVLSCQNGIWKRQGSGYWKDPVTTFTALPTSLNNRGDVRMVTDINRAFTWNGSIWVGLALDQYGNITIPGTATINTANIGNANIDSASINKLQGNLQITQTAVEGSACYGEGSLATSTTTSGLILSCQSGVWSYLTGNNDSGTICGLSTNGGAHATLCKGYDPYYECPPGYSNYRWLVSFGDGWMAWCNKI
jgi:type II secretory pathway pseudopilin PulG